MYGGRDTLCHISPRIIQPMNFDDLFNRYHWKAIRNCPGRYVLTDAPLDLTVEELLGVEPEPREFRVEAARDRVRVTLLQSGGGVISYLRPDGSCLHTLNTADGLQRKLTALGIEMPSYESSGGACPPRDIREV